MTKVYILTVALLLSLPACNRKKDTMAKPAKTSTTKKYVETDGSVAMFEEGSEERDEDDKDYSDDQIMSLFEEDEDEELTPAERAIIEADEEEQDADEFSWVDAQVDDEFKTVYFEFNHYGINPNQKKAVQRDIDQAKQLLAEVDTQANPLIVIEGHACQEGTPAYNLSLSEKRAKNVADLFVAAGIDKEIIKVVGRGQEVPAVTDAKSREDRAPNRRVEVRVIYT